MNQEEKKALDRAVEQIEKADMDPDKLGRIFEKLVDELPQGEIKDFFENIQREINVVNEIVDKRDEERIDEVVYRLEKVTKWFEGNERPKISEEIMEAFRNYFIVMSIAAQILRDVRDLRKEFEEGVRKIKKTKEKS